MEVRLIRSGLSHAGWAELLDFVEGGNAVGITRNGDLVAVLVPPDPAEPQALLRAVDAMAHPDIEHHAEVVNRLNAQTTKPWQAQCPCGWKGATRTAQIGAARDAVKHDREMAKAKKEKEKLKKTKGEAVHVHA